MARVTAIGTHLCILIQRKFNESLINSNCHNGFLTDPIEHENDCGLILIVRIKNMYIQFEMLLQILQGVIQRQDAGETRPPGNHECRPRIVVHASHLVYSLLGLLFRLDSSLLLPLDLFDRLSLLFEKLLSLGFEPLLPLHRIFRRDFEGFQDGLPLFGGATVKGFSARLLARPDERVVGLALGFTHCGEDTFGRLGHQRQRARRGLDIHITDSL
jgi:hypothetical protein